MARWWVKTERRARRFSGLVLTQLPKPCDKLRDRAEERLVPAGTKAVQESCARRALLVSGRRPHREVSLGYLGKLRTRPRQRGSTGQPTDWRRKLANAECLARLPFCQQADPWRV